MKNPSLNEKVLQTKGCFRIFSEPITHCAVGLSKFFEVKSADPHVKI